MPTPMLTLIAGPCRSGTGLPARCDAVLRAPGESVGADQDVATARERGLPVFFRLEDVPVVGAGLTP